LLATSLDSAGLDADGGEQDSDGCSVGDVLLSTVCEIRYTLLK